MTGARDGAGGIRVAADIGGYFRAIAIRTRRGTVVDPVLPAACGARGITGSRVMEAVLGALAQAVPDRVAADGEGGNTLISMGGRGSDGRPFVYTELFAGARGGSARGDGSEGVPHPGSNNANMPVEVAESTYPIRFEQYAIVADTAGAGRFRGANAQVREFSYLGPTTTLQMRSDKRRFRPYGAAGAASSTIVDAGLAGERVLPTIGPSKLRSGETVRHQLASGGGWGDPLDRDPAAVGADLVAEKLSPAAALRAYGVVVAPDGLVDPVATSDLRWVRRRERPGKERGR